MMLICLPSKLRKYDVYYSTNLTQKEDKGIEFERVGSHGIYMSQDVISATIAYLLTCQHGSRFLFSQISCVLVQTVLNQLEGNEHGDSILGR